MKSNILFIGENIDYYKLLKNKLAVQRACDNFNCTSFKDTKNSLLEKFDIIIIEAIKGSCEKFITSALNYVKIVIVIGNLSVDDDDYYYKLGIHDSINISAPDSVFHRKLLNYLNILCLENKLAETDIYLENIGVRSKKNKCYKLKYLKDNFSDIARINDCMFFVITLDESIKTKVSSNRLIGIINKSVRCDDLVAEGQNGIFYLILRDTTPAAASNFICSLQEKLGKELKIRAGYNIIGFNDFDEIKKITTDSLKMAIKQNELCSTFTDSYADNDWLDNFDIKSDKKFKFFNKIYENKLKNTVEPAFFRFKKDCGNKYNIIHYINKIESTFSFKDDKNLSELVLHYDGMAKINVEINHSGLDSTENSRFSIPLNKFDEKELTKLLKQLKKEYLQNIN